MENIIKNIKLIGKGNILFWTVRFLKQIYESYILDL